MASGCTDCRLRKYYERKPKSLIGRFWRWHTSWCPGWKTYMKSLPEEEQRQVIRHLDALRDGSK